MKFLYTYILSALLINSIISCSKTTSEVDCSDLKNCKMKFLGDLKSKIIISDSTNVEYMEIEEKIYFVKSKLNWIDTCSYKLTLIDFDVPDFKYNIGDTLIVQITDKKKDVIYMELDILGKNMKARYQLLD